MPFVLIIAGILMVVVGIRNTQSTLGKQIASDFTGPNNFFYWIAALFIVGALGYIEELKTPSRAFLALILITLLLSNRGFFAKFNEELQAGTAQPGPTGPPPPGAATGGATPASGGGGGGGIQGQLTQVAAIALPKVFGL